MLVVVAEGVYWIAVVLERRREHPAMIQIFLTSRKLHHDASSELATEPFF